jgi:hypothetical protein
VELGQAYFVHRVTRLSQYAINNRAARSSWASLGR